MPILSPSYRFGAEVYYLIKYDEKVLNLKFEIELNRNITVIQGDSATGKPREMILAVLPESIRGMLTKI